MAKRSLCMLLAVVTIFSLAVPAFAGEAPEEPVVTEEPVATEEPVVTEEPVATEEPVEATEEPVVTEEPVATEEPAVTEEPVATEEPIVEAAEAAEAPEATEEPVPAAATPSPSPSPSPAPTSGTCGENVNWAFDEATGTLTISGTGPMKDLGYDGKSASYYAYAASIQKVVIEPGVTRIGSGSFYAFRDYTSLTELVIPDTVTSIGADAFSCCEKLAVLELPDSLTTIETSAFSVCKALTDVVIPESVTSIGQAAFGDSGLTSVKLPSGIKTIENGVFGGCSNLKEIVIPESVTSIGNGAFSRCSSLTSVTLPSTLTTIERAAFQNCTSLTGIKLPDGLQNVGWQAFLMSGLTDITIPAGVSDLCGTFYRCTSLKTLTILNKRCQIMNYDEGTMRPVTANAADGPAAIDFYEVEPFCEKTTTIRGYAGSTAEAYAKKNGNPFVPLDDPAKPAPTATPEPVPLTAPKISKVSNAATGVKVTWGKVTGATKYRIYYKTTGSWKKLADTKSTSYTWKKAKSGTKYTFTVKAYKSSASGTYDSKGKSITYVAAPKVPTVKKVSNGIKITWSKVTGATKYRVYYKIGKGSWKTLVSSTTKTSYTWKAPKNGVKYTFTIKAYKGSTASSYNTTGKSITYKK